MNGAGFGAERQEDPVTDEDDFEKVEFRGLVPRFVPVTREEFEQLPVKDRFVEPVKENGGYQRYMKLVWVKGER